MSITLVFPVGYKPVLKHGDHDQSDHGNWATGNFDEKTEGEDSQNSYMERYGIKIENHEIKGPTGITKEELDAVSLYTMDAYGPINRTLRGEDVKHPIYSSEQIQGLISNLDKTIEESPDMFGEKNLFRVFSDRLIVGLEKGDVLVDKGFMSTTRTDLTDEKNAKELRNFSSISETDDIVGVILPSPSGKGKGLAVDFLKNSVPSFTLAVGQSDLEKEILLPRGSRLQFKGYKTANEGTGMKVAVFERMDG